MPTVAEMRRDADIMERSEHMVRGRDNSVAAIAWLNSRLRESDLGWTWWREGELVDPGRMTVVRTGYSGQECQVEIKILDVYDKTIVIASETLRLHAGMPGLVAMQQEICTFLERAGVELR